MTRVYDSRDIEKSRERVYDVIRSLHEHVASKALVKGTIATRLQAFFNTRPKHELDSSIVELIMTHALKAEQMGPGAFDVFIEQFLKQGECERIDVINATPGNIDDVGWMITNFASNAPNHVIKMIKEAIQLAGFAGKIVVERSESSVNNVELIRGYTFQLEPLIDVKSLRFFKPRVICIDGFAESVSELHHVFEAASSTKETVVMFLRGASDDVLNTCKVNFNRGTLKVLPVKVPFDLEGINTLVDLSIVTGAHLFSSNLGQLFTSIDLSLQSIVDEVYVNGTKVVIKNSANSTNVASHAMKLRERRLNENLEEHICQLLDKRIRSLTPNHVVMRLVADSDYVVNSQSIDYVLRAFASLTNHGTITVNDKKMLTDSYAAAMMCLKQCDSQLKSLGAIIRC